MIEKLVSEVEWHDALAGLPALTLPGGPVIFLAPHPDDESLAAGGLLAALASRGNSITVVAITDGGAAYVAEGDTKLAGIRRNEQIAALARLGIAQNDIVRLSVPDRRVHEHEAFLTGRLRNLILAAGTNVTLIAPWRSDFHSDHEAAGRVAERAAEDFGISLLRWFWWTWHRRDTTDLAVLSLKRFPLETRVLQQKRDAIAEHRSQLGEDAILPDSILIPAYRDFEVYA